MPLIMPLPPMSSPLDANGNPLATLPGYQAPQVNGPSVLGNVNAPTVSDIIQPQANVPVPSVLGTVDAPSRSSLALNSADNDVQSAQDRVQADTPKPYDWHAHGVLGNIGHVITRAANIGGDILDPAATSLIPNS